MQIKARVQEILLAPAAGIDGILKQEYAKGEVGGIMLFTQLADSRITDLKDALIDLNEEINND